VEGVVA